MASSQAKQARIGALVTRKMAARCGCRHGRGVPIHVTDAFRTLVLALVEAENVPPDTPFLTYRCPRCQEVTVISLSEFLGRPLANDSGRIYSRDSQNGHMHDNSAENHS